ncbi:hypothetical protein CALVIDRAFT_601860 [Calocera viscosa TUFC12733]|uniref:Uncharacterized protein n=1 Tax=Calocera viscosa (strain TUFC12733) TaxID=1330018 RepID=A0A167HRD0_CALVF|nr:hypothetical protein CALVIDRAFT_601860 [Calocera viscosa TUFC12733]
MPVFICPLTKTVWGTPDSPADLSSVALQSIDKEILSAEKGQDPQTRAARAGGSNSERRKVCKKLEQLVVLVRARHEKSRDPRDLDKAVDLAAECVHYTVLSDPERATRTHTLASLLGTRYLLFQKPTDLDGSIHHYASILEPSSPASFTGSTSPPAHKRSGSGSAGGGQETWMYEYSQRLAERYELRGEPSDLSRAESLCRAALEQKGLDGTALAERQSHLAYLLQYKTQSLARRDPPEVSLPDMLLCIGLAKQALARLPPSDPRRTMYRLRLATYLNTSFRYTNNSAHLDEAISIFDEEFPEFLDTDANGVAPTPPLSRSSTLSSSSASVMSAPSAQDPSKPYHLRAAAQNLLARYTAAQKKDPRDLERATTMYRRALIFLLSLHSPDAENESHASSHPLWDELSLGLLDCLDRSGRKRLNVVISGGGPVGQTLAMSIALQSVERSMVIGGPAVKVTLYESRLMDDGKGGVRWRGAEDNPPNTRRQQVITLQDAVIGNYDKAGIPWSKTVWNETLNPEGGERVWPTSRQVPIRQVEDTITEFVQSTKFLRATVDYKVGSMDAATFDTIRPWCDLFIGADGAGNKSFTINHPEFRFSRTTYVEEQMDRALGVFVDIKGPKRQQAKNVFLTIAQTIYLLNSNYGTLGYLNIRLPGMYMNAMGDNETLESLSNSDDILKRRIAFVIKGGLAIFDLPEKDVHAINRIELPMSNSTRYLATANRNPNPNPREMPGRNSTFPVVLAGDAAIKFNFWPGRGANSGLIGAFGLTTTLYDILPTLRPGMSIPVERFMLQVGLLSTLQVREHEGRGGYIQSIGIDQRYEDVFGIINAALPHPAADASLAPPVPPMPPVESSSRPASRASSPTPSIGALEVPGEGSGSLSGSSSRRGPRGPRDSVYRRALPRPPSINSLSSVANGNGNANGKAKAVDHGEAGQFDDPDAEVPEASPPMYSGNEEEFGQIVDLLSRKRLPSPAPTEIAVAEDVPLTQAVEVVRKATRAAKGKRNAPMSAQRKKTILERAKPLKLDDQGFILDPREMEALMQYDDLITRELIQRLQSRRDAFEVRDEWQQMHVKVSNKEFEAAVRKLHPALKKLIFLSEPWPTGKMNPQGWEVDPKIYRQPGIAPAPRVQITSAQR